MLTPIDIHNRQLKPAKIGGYDKKDIDDFMEEIIASYEELYNENRVLKEKITSLSEGIQYYKKMEGTLQKALVLAEKTSSETQEAAKSQADSVITEASAKAEALSRETKAEIDALRAEAQAQAEVTRAKANRELEETRNNVRKLVQSYENYRLQFKKLAEAQIEMLESDSFSIFVPELDELMNEAPGADTVLDNPGVIPINIGSPAPFEEPPAENVPASKSAVQPVEEVPVEPAAKPVEEVPVEPVKPAEESPAKSAAPSHQKLDVKFDDLSNSIAIPISSNMGPFTDLPEEDIGTGAATLQEFKIDSDTAPSIDINIGTSIGEEIEVSMSLDPTPSSRNAGIDIMVNSESLLGNSSASAEQVAVSEPTASVAVPIQASAEQPEVTPVSIGQPEITPVSIGQPEVTPVSMGQPEITPISMGQPEVTPVSMGQPEVTPVSIGQPEITPISIGQPEVTPISIGQPEVTPVSMGQPEAIPVSIEQPEVTPVSMGQPEVTPISMGQPEAIPVSVEQPAADPAIIQMPNESSATEPDILELAPEQPPAGQEATAAESMTEPAVAASLETSAAPEAVPASANPFLTEPDVLELAPEQPAVSSNALLDPVSVSDAQNASVEVPTEPQGMNIPLNFETPADMQAEPQGMNIPLNFENPADMQADPQGMNIPLNFETPADMQADPQGMNIPLNFETPADMQAEPQGMNIPLNFETPSDMQSEPQGMNIPLNFENPADMQADPQAANPQPAIGTPENMMADNPSVMPVADIPMMETAPMMEQAASETQQPSSNGLIGAEPADSAENANPFLDMSNMFDSPVQDMPAETEQADSVPASQGAANPAPADNGIISDAFIDPAAMFESPVSEAPSTEQEQPAEAASNPNDSMLDINPFNFIDPE